MADLASDVITEATSVFLNDPSKKRFTDAIMLPYVKRAHKELQLLYHNNGISLLKEVSTAIAVAADATTVSTPSDLIEPVKLEERAPGETTYIPMDQTNWEPDQEKTSHLRYWTWREEVIVFLGATADREVRIYYLKSLSPITTTSSALGVKDGLLFMSARVAELAAKFDGLNIDLANMIGLEGGASLKQLINRGTRTNQGYGTRRKSFKRRLR
jgi:hypothetical protein